MTHVMAIVLLSLSLAGLSVLVGAAVAAVFGWCADVAADRRNARWARQSLDEAIAQAEALSAHPTRRTPVEDTAEWARDWGVDQP